jgi:uncharacterized protein with GYD domain
MQMPKFLIQASYTTEGVKGLKSGGGTSRREVIERAAKSVGGTLECAYFAFGDRDVIVIADFPDNASAAALALAVGATGAVNLSTTPLLTPEEIDRAVKLEVEYQPPKG